MDLEIKKLGRQDLDKFVALIQVFEDVFEMKMFRMPSKDYLKSVLEKEGFFVFVALLNNQVLGGLTAYTIHQYYAEKPLVYIYDLAVKREFQRQGIGKKLIQSTTDYCKANGMEEVFVQADVEDDYAIEFYQSTGGTPEKVIHFSYPLNS